MRIGSSLLLIAAGAILKWAVTAHVTGLNLQNMGVILMFVGVIGLAIGTPLAILCDVYLAHQLYGVSRFNPLALGGAIFILSLCAFIAGIIPARRAASIDPMEALRNEQ